MFEKLLSLIPYNPGIAHQLGFYHRRMREEASIRRLGTVFLVLAFLVQSIAVLNPPTSAAQCNSTDIIDCGFSSAEDALQKCKDDKQGYQKFLHYYGISCAAFKDAHSMEIQTNGQNYYSSGRELSPAKDAPRDIPGTGTIYWRDLNVWNRGAHQCEADKNRYNCWTVLRIQDQDDKYWYVMYDCGNLVSPRGVPPGNKLRTPHTEDTIEIINSPAPAAPANTNPAPVQGNPGVQNPSAERSPYIPEGTTTVPVYAESHQVYPCQFNPSLAASDVNCPKPCDTNPSIPITSEQCFHPCPYNSTVSNTDKACKPCDKSKDKTDAAACLSIRKTASNITQGIADANNSTAKAGDTVTYTLYAENTGKETIQDFTFQEDLSDVLDYADTSDTHGGKLVDTIIAWPQRDLDKGEISSVQVTVKIKDPIPQTPLAANDPGGFDMIMTNVYGNSVNIKLPASPAKSVETTAAKLPNTGPGTTLLISATVVILAAYFYSRASLLARESDIAIKESV